MGDVDGEGGVGEEAAILQVDDAAVVDFVMVLIAERDEVVKIVQAACRLGYFVVDADVGEVGVLAAFGLAGEVVTDEGAHALLLPAGGGVGAIGEDGNGGDKGGVADDVGRRHKTSIDVGWRLFPNSPSETNYMRLTGLMVKST